MIKRYLSIFFLGFLATISFTQSIDYQLTEIQKADDLLESKELVAANKFYKNIIQNFSKKNTADTTKAHVFSQYAMSFGYQNDWKNALKYSHKAAFLFQKTYGKQHAKTVDEWYNLGYSHSALEDFDSLSFYWLKCIDAYGKIGEKYHDIALTYNNLASNFKHQMYYFKAYQYYKKAVENWEKVADEYPSYLAIGYDNLGANLDTHEGIYYLQKALNIKLKLGENPFRSYIELATKYTNLEQYAQAIYFYKKGITELQKILKNPPKKDFDYEYDLAQTYSLLSETYFSTNDFENALLYADKACNVPTIKNYPYKQVKYLIRKADILSKSGDNAAALAILEPLLLKTAAEQSPLFGYLTNVLAGIYANDNDTKKTLITNQLSIDFGQTRTFKTTTNDYLKKIAAKDLLLSTNSAISLSAHAAYQLAFAKNLPVTQQKNVLKTALFNVEQAISIFQEMQHLTTDFLYAKRKLQQAIDRQQQILFALHNLTKDEQYLKQGFTASEVGKFNTTLVNFNQLQLQSVANVPPKLFQQEKDLKVKIGHLKDKIFYAEKMSDNSDETSIRKWYDELFSLNQQYNELIKNYEKNYPKYYNIRHKIQPVSIGDLQATLDKKTLIVTYFVGEKDLFIYTISASTFSAFQQPITTAFQNKITDYREDLQSFKTDIKTLKTNGLAIYDLVLKNALSKNKNSQKLLIIPHKILSTIPFETLTFDKKTDDYLVSKYDISYAYSATLWQQQQTVKRQKSKEFWAGFAPNYANIAYAKKDTVNAPILSYFLRSNFLNLSGAKGEVEQISDLLNGKTYFGNAANEANFKNDAARFQVLHLAMHALLENDNPLYSKLLFTPKDSTENGFLTISELYNLELNADLAVLSACNTGFGKLQPGEGLMSLSQAFTAAGCPSTLTTLWQIPDAESADLMVYFYKNLQQGMTKSEALRQAKITYLNTSKNDRAKHPYFWAGFTLSGNDLPLQTADYHWIWWVLGVVILLILIGFFYFKNRKHATFPHIQN